MLTTVKVQFYHQIHSSRFIENRRMSIDQVNYYCSSDTFLSILKKSELWLTDLTLSNDSLEGRWALQEYLELFDQKDRLRRAGAKFDIQRALLSRVVLGICFSEHQDILSQWRGYANNGRGICITFSTRALEVDLEKAQPDLPGVRFAKINYDGIAKNGLPKMLSDVFRKGMEDYRENADGYGSLSRTLTDEQHILETDAISALYEHKNPAFREESEWRISVVQFRERIKKLDYRASRDVLSPYVRLPFSLSAIEAITLGPRNPTPKDVIDDLLRTYKCYAYVSKSRASYVER